MTQDKGNYIDQTGDTVLEPASFGSSLSNPTFKSETRRFMEVPKF
jgi:hypothetical protein